MNKCIAPDLRVIAVASALLTVPLALAQPAQQPTPASSCATPTTTAFDVATVKPSQIDSHSSHIHGTADSITASGSLLSMIEYAYDLHDFQLVGGPDWVRTATWDIVAKVDQPPVDWANLPGKSQSAIERQRTQALLAQRFALKCHFETKELPVYNLVLAKGGSRLTPTPADAAKKYSMDVNGRDREIRMEAYGVPMNTLINNLSQRLGRIVIDKTGLAGLYDFTLTYARDADAGSSASAAAEPSGPTIFTALQEQLGLRLESAKGPVPILVIDSAHPQLAAPGTLTRPI